MSLAARRRAARHLEVEYGVSERRACQVLALHRSSKRRRPGALEESELVGRIHALSERYPRFDYRKVYARLRTEGWRVSRERVRRIRRREGLGVVKKPSRRRPLGVSTATPTRARYPNHVWSYDFVHDETTDGRRFRCLTVLDEYTREGLAIHCARSITAGAVLRVLEALFSSRGAPAFIKSDNGPELIARQLTDWLREQGTDTYFIEPGSPWQNGHNESFNSVFRDGCLDRWAFYCVQEARVVIEQWLDEYNGERPHGALGDRTPAEFAASLRQPMEQAA